MSGATNKDASVSLKNWLEPIVLSVGFVITVYGFLSQQRSDTFNARLLAIVGYAVILLVILWISFINQHIQPFIRKICQAVFLVGSPLFFIWVGTWIAKTPVDLFVYPIERYEYAIYDFSGSAEPPDTGAGYLSVFNSYQQNRSVTKYSLDYTLPDQGSYTGFSITFIQPINLEGYKGLKLMIKFGDDQARLKLTLRDAAKNQEAVILGNGQYGEASNREEQEIEIYFENFPKVVHALVKEIVFSVDGDYARGQNKVTVRNIRLTK